MDQDTAAEMLAMLKKALGGTPHFFAWHPGEADGGGRLALHRRRLPKAEIAAWKREGLPAAKLVTGKVRKGEIGLEFATSQQSVPGGVAAMQRSLRTLGTEEGLPPLKRAVPVLDAGLDMAEEEEKAPTRDAGVSEAVGQALLELQGALDEAQDRALGDLDEHDALGQRQRAQASRHGQLSTALEHTEGDGEVRAEIGDALGFALTSNKTAATALGEVEAPLGELPGELIAVGDSIPTPAALQRQTEALALDTLAELRDRLDRLLHTRRSLLRQLARVDHELDAADDLLDLAQELLAGLAQETAGTREAHARGATARRLKAASSLWFGLLGETVDGMRALSAAVEKDDDDRSRAIAVYLGELSEDLPLDLSDRLNTVADRLENEAIPGGDPLVVAATDQIGRALALLEANLGVLALAEQNPYGKSVPAARALRASLMEAQRELEGLGG